VADETAAPVTEEPPPPPAPVPPIESRFLFVDVAALRAKQLRRGARPRLDPVPDPAAPPPELHKAERIAMEEVRRGLVSYELPELKQLHKGES
jgi:DNA-directed RNA polymerase omega subunit